MAINHTEYFFNSFRQEIGDKELARFFCSKEMSWLKVIGISFGVFIAISVLFTIVMVVFAVFLVKIMISKCRIKEGYIPPSTNQNDNQL